LRQNPLEKVRFAPKPASFVGFCNPIKQKSFSSIPSDITPSLESNFNSVYAQLGAANTFTAVQAFQAGNSGQPTISVSNPDEYGTGVSAQAPVDGTAVQGTGVQTAGTIGAWGEMPNGDGPSASYFTLNADDGYNAGVWADGAIVRHQS